MVICIISSRFSVRLSQANDQHLLHKKEYMSSFLDLWKEENGTLHLQKPEIIWTDEAQCSFN